VFGSRWPDCRIVGEARAAKWLAIPEPQPAPEVLETIRARQVHERANEHRGMAKPGISRGEEIPGLDSPT
jgi:hypothetical protein